MHSPVSKWGEPVLWGGSENDTSLRWCVDRMLAGASPTDILKENAYAYCVHRRRLWDFYGDIVGLERHGVIVPPVER